MPAPSPPCRPPIPAPRSSRRPCRAACNGRNGAATSHRKASGAEGSSSAALSGIPQPIVVGPKVKNVPKEGYWAWDPGGYIGLYQPDTFCLAQCGGIALRSLNIKIDPL